MKAKTLAALIAVFLCLNFAHAETYLKIGGFSHHLSEKKYNSFHRVFIVRSKTYFAGYFKNSFYDDSFVIGKRWHLKKDSLFDFGLSAGFVYGYRDCYKRPENPDDKKRVCVMFSPDATLYKQQVKPSFSIVSLTALAVTFDVEI